MEKHRWNVAGKCGVVSLAVALCMEKETVVELPSEIQNRRISLHIFFDLAPYLAVLWFYSRQVARGYSWQCLENHAMVGMECGLPAWSPVY